MPRFSLLLVLTLSFGCAHDVLVTSNVPHAEVRVDGERLGRVGDGVTFSEQPGITRSVDVEVRAAGYRTARRQLTPTQTDPRRGIPATLFFTGSCCVASCIVPSSLLGLSIIPIDDDTGAFPFFATAGAVSASFFVISAVLAIYGTETLPDAIEVILEPDDAMSH